MGRFYPEETEATRLAEVRLAQLEGLFDTYREESAELLRQHGADVGRAFRRYFNQDEVQNSPIHIKFYEDAEGCVRSLAEALTEAPSEALARQAVALFLAEKPKGQDACVRSWLIALEAVAIPLVDFLQKEDAVQFCLDYRSQYDWVEMMPRQQELYEALCKKAGQKVQKSRLFAAFGNGRRK